MLEKLEGESKMGIDKKDRAQILCGIVDDLISICKSYKEKGREVEAYDVMRTCESYLQDLVKITGSHSELEKEIQNLGKEIPNLEIGVLKPAMYSKIRQELRECPNLGGTCIIQL